MPVQDFKHDWLSSGWSYFFGILSVIVLVHDFWGEGLFWFLGLALGFCLGVYGTLVVVIVMAAHAIAEERHHWLDLDGTGNLF